MFLKSKKYANKFVYSDCFPAAPTTPSVQHYKVAQKHAKLRHA